MNESEKPRLSATEPSADPIVPHRVQTFQPLVDRRDLGRYELLYEIGRGGMATVYLGRLRGPGGFHKWVAIKSIHPHLAAERRFVDMFLDEARIAASLQHPNVCQVLELGEDRGEHFIAMEYLQGEHLGVVANEALPARVLTFEVAAYICAAVAAALHDAHEAKDPRGHPLRLVHRDVTPHNVFVTYDGAVKLTDFGVAKAMGRISSTESGSIKGKWSYMSPEQVLGEQVDRRTDIFALGIVLWEITCGRRLFRAESEVRTVMRITSGNIPVPTDLDPSYPRELEAIVLRALSRRPQDRYQTAAALGQALDDFLASSHSRIGPRIVAELMAGLFRSQIKVKEALLLQVAEPTVSAVTASEQMEIQAPSQVSGSQTAVPPSVVPTKKSGRAGLWIGIIVALCAVAGLAVLGTLMFLDSEQDAAAVRIESRPSGAQVSINGVVQSGATPILVERVERGRHKVELSLAGHQPYNATFDVSASRLELSYHLQPLKGPSKTADAGFVPTRQPDNSLARESDAQPQDVDVAERAPTKEARPRGFAYLNLLATPWAQVWVNGKLAGTTPLVRHKIPAGRVKVKVQREGTKEIKMLRFHAKDGQTIPQRVTF